jgi:hypothetical protein
MLAWESVSEWAGERVERARVAVRTRVVDWWERRRQPAWLRAARCEVRWRVEEWRWRFGVWWTHAVESFSERGASVLGFASEPAARGGTWLAARIAPLASRSAAWFQSQSIRAAERRESFKFALAELRDRRLARLHEILGPRFSEAADISSRGIKGLGLGWKHAAAGVFLITTVALISFALREPPPEPLSANEISLVRSFVRPGTASRTATSQFHGKLPPRASENGH